MIGKRVQIYFNLHKKVYSIRDKRTRLVIGHTDNITLKNVVFKVSKRGRERVLEEKRKNVHAVVEGTVCYNIEVKLRGGEVIYNPYLYKTFVTKNHKHIVADSTYISMKLNENSKPIMTI